MKTFTFRLFVNAKDLQEATGMSYSWAQKELATIRQALGRKRITFEDLAEYDPVYKNIQKTA